MQAMDSTNADPPAATTITGTWMSTREVTDPLAAQSVDPREETLRQFGAHGAAVLGFCRAMIAGPARPRTSSRKPS